MGSSIQEEAVPEHFPSLFPNDENNETMDNLEVEQNPGKTKRNIKRIYYFYFFI